MKAENIAPALLVLLIIGIFFISGCVQEEAPPAEDGPPIVSNTTRTGIIASDEIWSGAIHVTGDIDVIEGVNLTILPGTVIKVALTDDQHKGSDEPITDPYNFPKDPPFYEKEKITIYIGGTLNAVGTADNRIIFTSDSENPTTYDWRGLDIVHGRLEYAIVEYAQGNIQIQHSSDVVISNNIIRNSLTCCICIGHSNQLSPQILNNDIYNCGHEGIDYAGGSAIIKGNYFHWKIQRCSQILSEEDLALLYIKTHIQLLKIMFLRNLQLQSFFLEIQNIQKNRGGKL